MGFLLYTRVGKSNMLKRVYLLFKIARKLASSGALETINEIYNLPLSVKILFNFLSFGSERKKINNIKTPGVKLCIALEGCLLYTSPSPRD